mmetsp:Transcript_40686/g.72820  ORF Transcript_40686/g.72820 Transcript_40686/m.72820 type:complete len:80 (+) Transcript_40686:868-1107(+)
MCLTRMDSAVGQEFHIYGGCRSVGVALHDAHTGYHSQGDQKSFGVLASPKYASACAMGIPSDAQHPNAPSTPCCPSLAC